ncbi:hypothetical protein [Halobellus salinisoli]|uniref:hypothetical protein n=1 Tax=Halobellus salinisoli TaxID=3108500 RepID=UPI0030084434
MTDALDAVVDAALERALVDERDARRYFALAGALERLDRTGSTNHDRPVDPLCASLVSTIAVRALAGGRDEPELDADAWSPGSGDQWIEFVATGAFAALRRFDADPDTVAAQCGLTPAELDRYRRGDRSGE